MPIRFPGGLADIKAADFSTFDLHSFKESDLGLLAQKCLELIMAGGSDTEAAKAMLALITSEKNQRAGKSTRKTVIFFSILTLLSVLAVGLLQAYVLYATSYAPADDGDDGGSCEQQNEFQV